MVHINLIKSNYLSGPVVLEVEHILADLDLNPRASKWLRISGKKKIKTTRFNMWIWRIIHKIFEYNSINVH